MEVSLDSDAMLTPSQENSLLNKRRIPINGLSRPSTGTGTAVGSCG